MQFSFGLTHSSIVYVACDKANAQVRASIRWQNFVIPICLVLATIAGIVGVRYYLRDETEISLLEKAEADRRLKPLKIGQHRHSVAGRAQDIYRRHSDMIQSKVESIKSRLQQKPKPGAKILFGIEVEPRSRPFPIKPGKLKIFIGFFQIFGNFRSSFSVNWSPKIQNIMNISSQFNLVRSNCTCLRDFSDNQRVVER